MNRDREIGRHTLKEGKWDVGGEFECCYRCLRIVKGPEDIWVQAAPWLPDSYVEKFYPGRTRTKKAVLCADAEACNREAFECRKRFWHEIQHRTKWIEVGGCLLVIRDVSGHHFETYGNYFVKVEPREDPQEKWLEQQIDCYRKGEEGALVLEFIAEGLMSREDAARYRKQKEEFNKRIEEVRRRRLDSSP